MKVRDVMTKGLESISASSSVTEAARKMEALNVGCLPVEDNGRIMGMITDRDITIRCVAHDEEPGACLVRDVMTSGFVSCYESDSVDEAIQLMEDHKVRRLVVCDNSERSIGMLSLGDIASKTHQDELAGEVLEIISEPCRPSR